MISGSVEGRPARGRRRLVLIIAAAVAVLAVLAIVSVAIGLFEPSSASRGQSRISVRDGHLAFEIRVPEGTAISDIRSEGEAEGCPRSTYRLNDHGLVVEAVSAGCRVPQHQPIQNGDHGTYRTLDDVPGPIRTTRVKTWLGTAQVFTQSYKEYTNVGRSWREPVAIVTLDAPVDPDYPTLVVRSEKGALSREEFTALVKQLSEPS